MTNVMSANYLYMFSVPDVIHNDTFLNSSAIFSEIVFWMCVHYDSCPAQIY